MFSSCRACAEKTVILAGTSAKDSLGLRAVTMSSSSDASAAVTAAHAFPGWTTCPHRANNARVNAGRWRICYLSWLWRRRLDRRVVVHHVAEGRARKSIKDGQARVARLDAVLGVAGNEDGDAFGDLERQAVGGDRALAREAIIEFCRFMPVQIQSAMRRKIRNSHREFGRGRAIRRDEGAPTQITGLVVGDAFERPIL